MSNHPISIIDNNTKTWYSLYMRTEPIHKSKRPLRWIANGFNHLAVPHLVKAFDLQDQDKMGYWFKYHLWMWDNLNKPYAKWGTTHLVIRFGEEDG